MKNNMLFAEHVGWLEGVFSHVHEGEQAAICFKWGSNMQLSGLAEKDGLSAFVIHPDGKEEVLKIANGHDEYYVLNFIPHEHGLYHVLCKNVTYHENTCYTQYSHFIVPVGHDSMKESVPAIPELPLRVIPEKWKKWQAGETINFALYHEDTPLENAVVELQRTVGSEGQVRQKTITTTQGGQLSVETEEAGKYLLIVRHQEAHLTYTFAFNVLK